MVSSTSSVRPFAAAYSSAARSRAVAMPLPRWLRSASSFCRSARCQRLLPVLQRSLPRQWREEADGGAVVDGVDQQSAEAGNEARFGGLQSADCGHAGAHSSARVDQRRVHDSTACLSK
jgi:hypothetical protein